MRPKNTNDLKLLQVERPLIAYPLCFDDVMKTCLEHDGISQEDAFGSCRLMEYNKDKSWDTRLSFHNFGFDKYSELGLVLRKEKIENFDEDIKTLQEEMKSGWVFLHFDGYYCPWDNLQKLRRWHSMHIVILLSVNLKKKYVIVSDAFYVQNNRKVSFQKLIKACKFYVVLKTSGYNRKNSEEIFNEYAGTEWNASNALQNFYNDFICQIENKIPKEFFSAEWIKEWEKAFMTRHYLWLFYRRLYRTTGDSKHGALANAYFMALEDWKECVVYSHKGAKRKDKMPLCKRFADTLLHIIEREKYAEKLLAEKSKAEIFLLSEIEERNTGRMSEWDISKYFNSRACKSDRKDFRQADITGEGEYILPEKALCRHISLDSICYKVLLGEEKDHICCVRQFLRTPSGNWKGVSLLVCSEWGRSQLLLELQGKKREYITDYIVNDFSVIASNSVRIGASYLSGGKSGVRFQKNVYFQSVTFMLPDGDTIQSIVLPHCASLHIFGAVLWE